MDPLGSEEAVPESTELVSRARQLSTVPDPRAVLSAADSPRTFWAAPGEATVVGSGAATTIRTDGPDRFRTVREAADELFSVGDVHAGALAARPRLFGGFAFTTNTTGRDRGRGIRGRSSLCRRPRSHTRTAKPG